MGFFDDIFAGMFDFNGDGKTDIGEEWVGYMIINDCMKEEKKESTPYYGGGSHLLYDSLDDDLLEDDAIDPIDFSTPPVVVDDSWMQYCEDGSDYGLFPEDFDSEEDYNDALENARLRLGEASFEDFYASDEPVTVPIKLTFEITYPGKEQLEAINEADFPNRRSYRAAYGLCELEHGNPYIPSESSPEAEAERFNFILSGSCIAARYLTPFDGFLYAQAIKENFTLPISIADEDEESTVWFPDVFMELAEEDPKLAVEVWAWCIKEFGPYQKYMKNNHILYNYLLSDVDEYPAEFRAYAAEKLITDVDFCKGLLSQNPEMPCGIVSFITTALSSGKVKDAQVIFTAVILNPVLKGKDVENFINYIISDCSNWEELETMEAVKIYILPIVKKVNDKRIQRVLPKIIEEIEHYITTVESSKDKYQYSRSFSWRLKYKDNCLFDVDPLNFTSEDEYIEAVDKRKNAWKKKHPEAKFYDISLDTIDSEEDYQAELNQKKESLKFKPEATSIREHSAFNPTDKVYNFCAVIFSNSSVPYSYLCEIENVKIGDYVVVPVGFNYREVIGQVVSLSQHTSFTAPIEISKAKKVLRIQKKEDSQNGV